MARRNAAPPAPQYGEHKPRVIEFLRALIMAEHKPEGPIRVIRTQGEPRLHIRCVRCGVHVAVPIDGAMHVAPCAPFTTAKGESHGSAESLFGRE